MSRKVLEFGELVESPGIANMDECTQRNGDGLNSSGCDGSHHYYECIPSKTVRSMPREYTDCRPGSQRYEVKTEAMGRAISMCRALADGDTLARVGRRTRCYDPTKDGSKRKQCRVLVRHAFATVVPPSYYLPGELQRAQVGYECANDNQLLMAPFDGQGQEYTVEHATDHIVIGPVFSDGTWAVACMDPASLVPYGATPPAAGDTLDARSTRRAMRFFRYLPTAEECRKILERWDAERRHVCRDDYANLFATMAAVRGLVEHELTSELLFEPVRIICATVNTSAKRRRFRELCYSLWSLGMYQRRWAGPGRAYPIEEDDTLRHVTAAHVSPELAGQTDPVTGVPLDEISTAADGAEGLLVNAMRMHGRRILELLDDASWLGNVEAEVELPVLEAASLHAQALVPRATQPSRLVHSLLPVDGMTIRQTAQSCVDGQMCIRMGSARLCLSAVMLSFALGSPGRDEPWRQQTAAQGDPILLLDRLANII